MRVSPAALLAATAMVFAPALGAADAAETAVATGIDLIRIEGIRKFPEATEPGSILFACAQDPARLETFFAKRGAPFRPELVRKQLDYQACHIFYEPTIPGFRALPDNRRIAGFAGGLDPGSLVGNRKNVGDSLHVAQAVLNRISRPLDVMFSVIGEFDRADWEKGLARAFPDSPHRFTLIKSGAAHTHPWGQDFVKAGEVNGELRLLTPRRLFEGRASDGAAFLPMLEAFTDARYVRSKLSWEGGDMQFIADPKAPARTILFHGGSSHDYWGANLAREDSSYVLQVEFGADATVDMSLVGPHADYLTAFLPDDNVAVVAEPVRDDLELANSVAEELVNLYGDRAADDLRALKSLLQQASGPEPSPEALEHASVRVQALLKSLPAIEAHISPELKARLEAHQAKFCAADPKQCYLADGRRIMLREDPALLKEVYDAAADVHMEPLTAKYFLHIIESQLPNFPDTITDRIEEQVAKIRKLGFKVIRAPFLHSPEAFDVWPGISYTNFLLFEKTLFVPAAGLGKTEERIFRTLQKRLPQGYELVPVYARFGLINNGGVHCVFGIIREP